LLGVIGELKAIGEDTLSVLEDSADSIPNQR
jgi:hypothetical protein